MRDIGIFGGTFDPFHKGHLRALQLFENKYCFEKIFVIPTGIPPHKRLLTQTTAADRLEMARLAVQDIKKAEISNFETEKEGKSYTYETVTHFKSLYPKKNLVLYTGSDMFLTLQDWKNPEMICALARIAVFSRTGRDLALLKKQKDFLSQNYSANCDIFDEEPLVVSSTEIREKILEGQDISAFVPGGVLEYIIEKKLYRQEK